MIKISLLSSIGKRLSCVGFSMLLGSMCKEIFCPLERVFYVLYCELLSCRKKLARRLLFDKSANDEHERSILTKLKQQCGGQFTSKMEGMVTDLTVARDHQTKFEEFVTGHPELNPGIDLAVTVLTTGFWPSYKTFDINLPAEMVS